MDRAEWWILDSVATFQFPIDALATRDGVAFTLNRKWHGLSFDALVNTLYGLFQKGDLIAGRLQKQTWLGEFVPTRDEIIAGLSYIPPYRQKESLALSGRGEELYYWLTAQGGTHWEAISSPEWSRYVEAFYFADPDEGTIIASNQALAEKYFSLVHHLCSGTVAIAGSERWDVLEPWQATYWKTLPSGCRVRFEYKSQEEAEVKEQPLEVRQFFEEINNWYTRY